MSELQLRRASLIDCAALEELQRNSITRIAAAHYSREQVDAFLRHAANAFQELVRGAQVWVLGTGDELVACAGWHAGAPVGSLGRAAADRSAAEVRSVYVRGDWTRRGLAGRLLDCVEREAAASGAARATLAAMRGSEPFYAARGYVAGEVVSFDLGGTPFPGRAMAKPLSRRPDPASKRS